MTRLELPLHYVSTVDCEDLALLRQKVEVVTCELLSRDSVRTSLLSCDKAHKKDRERAPIVSPTRTTVCLWSSNNPVVKFS